MDCTVKPDDITLTESAQHASAGLQPFLHEKVVSLHAPSLVISAADGQLSSGVDGFYHGDCRALSRLVVEAECIPIVPIQGGLQGADRASFLAVLRGLGESTPDPATGLRRRRLTQAGRLEDTIELVNNGVNPVECRLTVSAATDLATIEEVKSGQRVAAAPPQAADDGQVSLSWSDDDITVCLTTEPVADALNVPLARFSYDIALEPGASWTLKLVCTAAYTDGDQFPPPPPGQRPWRQPVVNSADTRLNNWLGQSLSDLDHLRLADSGSASPERPDQFLAAGAPWFLTLFGRDSLWAARMLLPLGTGLAAGTLRTLARRQGRISDRKSEEEPGKILHEVRRDTFQTGRLSLPPVYYGTVDATPLWLILLHDAWRWGLDQEQVEQLLPHAEAALGWMESVAKSADDGFLKYEDSTGHGLSNQGWKDSEDSIRHSDGRRGRAPLALCEVQAYAYEAARGAAELLRAFARPGADFWDEWAETLASRFRRHFWIEDENGPYPAVALDGDGTPIDSVTSGFGHLLGTGLLDAQESALLATRLGDSDLNSGYGLRTLSKTAQGYNPMGYHIGSIWPHDTAIAVHGLARSGFPDTAAVLAEGLITASTSFAGRLPELFCGHGVDDQLAPAPYPASCRPQAWAAASSVLIVQAALGLAANVPEGRVTVAPSFARDFGPLTVTGLEIAGQGLDITVGADGRTTVVGPHHIAVTPG
ncbi:glycogen debranching N-terminal domain-containing protein [Streptomyces sp. NPDC058739]|uniref:amylo-alpha-1,6-glucosidase n=1 Tax=Streptomyces sp. NPDC058739 TaxID=3346618 RepID=UPI0036BAAEE8